LGKIRVVKKPLFHIQKHGTSMGNIIMSLKEKEQVVVFEQLKRKEISKEK
jgi:hypothetical protein